MEKFLISISNKTKNEMPVGISFFASAKEEVLGKDYELSIAIVGKNKIAMLNKSYRGKNEPTDILSFPLDRKSGEIFINPEYAKKKAKLYGRPYSNFLKFLFIHGLFHLKGMLHGSRMESEEEKIRRKFSV